MKGRTFSHLELKLLETIETEGSIRTDRLRKQLKLEGKENNSKFHRALTNLESYALILGAEDPHPERHMHANIWQTWDTRTGNGMGGAGLSYPEALGKLFGKTIDACVLAREDQVGKWFQWSKDMEPAKEEMLKEGLAVMAGSFLVTPRVISE